MTARSQTIAILMTGLLTAAWGALLPGLFGERAPQIPGESVLALLLGDARQALSAALMDKADEYYHGGVRHTGCALGGGTHHHGEHEADGCHTNCCAPDHAHSHGRHTRLPDPWRWINGGIHLQEHRHAAGAEIKEVLPWLWGACRASPGNLQAYESTAYTLERMLQRPRDAAALLEEGIRNNPESAQLEFSLGEIALRSLQDTRRAERAFSAALDKWRPSAGESDEEALEFKSRILFYLGFLARERGDHRRAAQVLAQAELETPGRVSTRDLKRLLEAKR